MNMTIEEAARAAGGRLIGGEGLNSKAELRHICLNSKEAGRDSLFVPIIGERVDAHRFIGDAFAGGAVCALSAEHQNLSEALSDESLASRMEGKALIAVSDTKEALQRLGRWYREHRVRIPLIGVTGSVGKTTTREMIACALSAERSVYATKGNSNSQVGVPITITETDAAAQIGVVELGMSEFGEMHRIAEAARVDAAVMTNIGISHIGNLGTQENILKEKLHILDGSPDGTPLFLNGDDPLLSSLTEDKIHAYGIAAGRRIPLIFYGTGENAGWRILDLSLSDGCPRFLLQNPDGEPISCSLSVPGMHMVRNAAAAIAVSAYFGVDPKKASDSLSRFSGVDGRGEIFSVRGIQIIDDSYNAAPDSMKAGLSVLSELPAGGRRIAVLADMLELGPEEKRYHEEVGAFIRERALPIDCILLYGPLSEMIGRGALGNGADIRHFETLSALSDALFEMLAPGDCVLLKGSNAMGLRKLAEALREGKS